MKKILIMMMSILFFLNSVHFTVKADDDDDDDHNRKKYEYYKEEWTDDDDDDDDDYHEGYANEQMNITASQWYLWTRTTGPTKGEMPFSEPENMIFKDNNSKKQLSLYSIPMDGELFIPGKSLAEFLGAKASFHPTSRILEMNTDYTELIFRADTNIAYENNIKTPIPAKAMFFSGDVYLPVSVVANGLGYSVEWNAEQQITYFQKMNK